MWVSAIHQHESAIGIHVSFPPEPPSAESPISMAFGEYKEGWAPKNWCFQIVVLEKTLKSPLNSKEIKLVKPKGIQPWIFIGRTDAEAPKLWPPDMKSQLTGRDSDAGKYWGRRRGWQRMSWLYSITDSMDMNMSKFWETVEDRGAWLAAVHGVTRSRTQLSNWTPTAGLTIFGNFFPISKGNFELVMLTIRWLQFIFVTLHNKRYLWCQEQSTQQHFWLIIINNDCQWSLRLLYHTINFGRSKFSGICKCLLGSQQSNDLVLSREILWNFQHHGL